MERVLAGLLCLFWGACAGQAQPVSPGDDLQISRLIQALPPTLRDRMVNAPDRFVETVASVVTGYGGPDGIDTEGIDLFFEVSRAAARSRTISLLMDADLDNGGTIGRTELESLCKTVSANQRGQLRRLFDRADENRDSMITAPELRREADVDAQKSISESRELALRSLPLLDIDGDGLVSIAEVMRIAEGARAPANTKTEAGEAAGSPDP